MYKKIVISMLLLILINLSNVSMLAQADGNRVSYSVEALIPDNQIDVKQSYFDLKMIPNQKQELGVVIHNNEKEDIVVLLSVHNATTNSNGLVVYEYKEAFDSSLEVPQTEILSFPEEAVTIPAGESKTVLAKLHTPKEEFDGIILGGLHFEKVIEEEEASEGVNIQNKYAYVIGVQLSENTNEVSPDLHLKSVHPKLVNHRTAVIANIQNSEPTLIKDLSVHARVYEKGKQEVLKEKKQTNINMAPNSNMDILIDWDNQPLAPGTYLLEMEASHENEVWEWQEEFVIEKTQAKQLNENAIELEKKDFLWLWFISGMGVLLVIIVNLLFYIRKIKAEKTSEDR